MPRQKIYKIYPKALVTGGSRGIGRAIVEMLLDEGVEVWATSRSGDNFLEHPKLHVLKLDLAEESALEEFIQTFKAQVSDLSLLVNNAGYGVFESFDTFPPREIPNQLNVLLEGPIRLVRGLYSQMQLQKHAAIVNVSSLGARFPLPFMSLYVAAKAGLSGFSQALMLEARSSHVSVVDFQLGDFCTGFNQSMPKVSGEISQSMHSAWEVLEKNINNAPRPEYAAKCLKKYLLKKKSGTYICGNFFQAKIAPFLARFASADLLQACLRKYFKV